MEYIQIIGMPDQKRVHDVQQLHAEIFAQTNVFSDDTACKANMLTLIAYHNGDPVGYKIGYERKPGHYYSWLGGVHPQFRNQGIASELMRRQHEWCMLQGYKTIRTHTKNKWRDMLIRNLRHGFDVIGTYTDDHGEPKIILQKLLDLHSI